MDRVKLMTYQQAATFYAVTVRTVQTWAEKGAITVVRTPSGRPRIVQESCVAIMKNTEDSTGTL